MRDCQTMPNNSRRFILLARRCIGSKSTITGPSLRLLPRVFSGRLPHVERREGASLPQPEWLKRGKPANHLEVWPCTCVFLQRYLQHFVGGSHNASSCSMRCVVSSHEGLVRQRCSIAVRGHDYCFFLNDCGWVARYMIDPVQATWCKGEHAITDPSTN